MRRFLFYCTGVIAAIIMGWNFGRAWMPYFGQHFLHSHQSITRMQLVGEFICAAIAIIIAVGIIRGMVERYTFRNLVFVVLGTAASGLLLAGVAMLVMYMVAVGIIAILVIVLIFREILDDIFSD